MAADETGTHARVSGLRKGVVEPEIAGHRGRIVKFTGDGVLAVFASAVEAIECAAAIQKGLSQNQSGMEQNEQIWLRIGVNIGDIIVEEEDIYGDSVNVADRLQELSDPGGICVSQIVYDYVRTKTDLAFESAGEHRVKNIPEPIAVYRVVSERRLGETELVQAGLRAAVAVLPFENLAGDERWDRLAAGICEDIITDLARQPMSATCSPMRPRPS
jgi:adenylate cyclase